MSSPLFIIDYRPKRPVRDWLARHLWLGLAVLLGAVAFFVFPRFALASEASLVITLAAGTALLLLLIKLGLSLETTRARPAGRPATMCTEPSSVDLRLAEAIAEDGQRGSELREHGEAFARQDQQAFWDRQFGVQSMVDADAGKL